MSSASDMKRRRPANRVLGIVTIVVGMMVVLIFGRITITGATPIAEAPHSVEPETRAAATVAPALLLLHEGFEGATFPPTGWQAYLTELGVGSWHVTSTLAYSGTNSAWHDDGNREQDSWLVLPPLTPTVGSRLLFQQYQRYPDFFQKHSVWASTGNPDPKEGDYELVENLAVGTENAWELVDVAIGKYGGKSVFIAIRYEGSFADEWIIDEVMVTGELGAASSSPTALGSATYFTASLAGTGNTYQWDFGDTNSGSGANVSHTYAQTGTYTATVTATGSNGVFTATTKVIVQTAVADLTANNDGPTTPGNATTLSATIAAGDAISYSWKLGDGSPVKHGATVSHTYAHGIYTATVTAVNLVSSQSASTTIMVEQPIEGLAVVDDAPTVLSRTTTFSITITSGTNVSYTWAFGDGAITRGVWRTSSADYWTRAGLAMQTVVLTHTYDAVGTYEAVFNANNLAGKHTVSTTVDVDVPVAAPIRLYDFENRRLPDDWYQMTVHLDSVGWIVTDSLGHNSDNSFLHPDTFGPQDSWLVMDLVTPTTASELQFWQHVKYTHVVSNHSVWVSTNRGDPKFGDFELFSVISPTVEQQWEPVALDLAAYADQPIYIAFRYQGNYSARWAIDDVGVSADLIATNDSVTTWGNTTTLTASVRMGSRIDWHWSFGDGTTGAGRIVPHIYASPGDYTATVTATNSINTVTATTVVQVRDVIYLPIAMKPAAAPTRANR